MTDEMTREARLQALNIAVEQIEKQHGKGSVMRLGEGPVARIESISIRTSAIACHRRLASLSRHLSSKRTSRGFRFGASSLKSG